MDEAIVTLRDSAQYGVAMFPDTGESKRKGAGGEDEMDVADRIVMERARIRRKELAEEERVEKEMLEEERAAQRARARESRREKAMERAQQARQTKVHAERKVGTEEASEASEASETRRARRGTRQQAVTADPDSDAMSVDSLASRRSTRIAKKEGRGDVGKTTGATVQPNGSDSGSVEFVDDSKRKASTGRSNTKERSAEPGTRVRPETTAPPERKKPFSGFASLDNDGERDSTPRPTRQRRTDASATDNPVNALHARVLPLQVARNRSGAG